VNGEGFYEGGKHSGEGGLLGESIIFIGLDCMGHFGRDFWGRLGDCITGFWLAGEACCRTEIGDTCCWEFWARGPGILMESWS
jgi:hypothetical protein